MQHFGWRWKAFDGIGKVGVWTAHTGNHCADAGKHLLKIKAIKVTNDAFGLAEIEDAALASGTQDAKDFSKAGIVICEVAKAKGRCDQGEVLIRKWQIQGIGLDPTQT